MGSPDVYAHAEPAGHGEHETAPEAEENAPAAQAVHDAAPEAENVPTAQNVHAEGDTAPAEAEDVPAPHGVHAPPTPNDPAAQVAAVVHAATPAAATGLRAGDRIVSTTNRNFEGRQGRGARTHLVGPATAAATAIAGKIVDISRTGGM